MSVWYSQVGRQSQDASGDVIYNVTEVYATVITDIDSQFAVNIEQFNFVEILEVTAVIIGQALSTVDSVVDKLAAAIIEITDTVVKGVVIKPQAVGVGVSAPIARGGQGQTVKVKIKGRK